MSRLVLGASSCLCWNCRSHFARSVVSFGHKLGFLLSPRFCGDYAVDMDFLIGGVSEVLEGHCA